MTQIQTHRIKHLAKAGYVDFLRVHGAPDCDMAAAFVLDILGGEVLAANWVEADAQLERGEIDLGDWADTAAKIAKAEAARRANAHFARRTIPFQEGLGIAREAYRHCAFTGQPVRNFPNWQGTVRANTVTVVRKADGATREYPIRASWLG